MSLYNILPYMGMCILRRARLPNVRADRATDRSCDRAILDHVIRLYAVLITFRGLVGDLMLGDIIRCTLSNVA